MFLDFDLDYGNNDNNDVCSYCFTNLSVVDAGNLTVYINYANESLVIISNFCF